jgi:putative peptidoglycan lipid II flippase
MYLPIGLFGVSIGTAVLPAVSRHAAADDRGGMRHTLARGLAMMLMVNVPATVGLLVLAPSIVRLLFEHGQFQPADTAATASAVRLYAVGLVGYSAARITSPAFYAINRSRVPVLVSLATIALNIVLSILFVRLFGFAGLALSTSIAAIANAAALIWLLHRHLDGIEGPALTVVLAKVTVAAAVMGAAAAAVDWRFSGSASAAFTAQMVSVAASIGAALLVLVVAAKFLGLSEFDEVAALVRARVQKLLGS